MNLEKLKAVAQSVRALSIDSIERSKSGHPGLPMGSADIGAVLYGEVLNINPKVSDWINRDRFVLSAGHGSMLLYSLLHLSGFKLTLDDLKNFRQIDSKTPGHPEYGHTDGVEATTGPLGAGVSNCVGLAIAETMMAEKFNTEKCNIIDNYTYGLVGDGCLMEGISYEAASLAGHLGLGKLILLYDSNNITIEGSTSLSTSEDILKRFDSFGWQTLKGDGHNIDEIKKLIDEAKSDKKRPTIIEFKTTIGYGSPNRAGTSKIHGSPLGENEINETRLNLGIPQDTDFYINPLASELFEERNKKWNRNYQKWVKGFEKWSIDNPDLYKEWAELFNKYKILEIEPFNFAIGEKISTRKSGGLVLNHFAKSIPSIIGGSADLNPSTNTELLDTDHYSKDNRVGRNINFGIREHAMGGITNGLALYGSYRPFASTFLVFSDYMKPTIRLAALMNIGSIFIFTHDSIFVGEDGPTHQPIEHIESLRGIPNLTVLRPGDAQECFIAYKFALLNKNSPTAIVLSRQNLETYNKTENWQEDYLKGGYIVQDSKEKPDTVIIATGSEVNMALEASKLSSKKIRVVSISSRKKFLRQPKGFRDRIIPPNSKRVVIEAGITYGWNSFVTNHEDIIGIDSFGYSGYGDDVAKKSNFTIERVIERL